MNDLNYHYAKGCNFMFNTEISSFLGHIIEKYVNIELLNISIV